jgi:class 3 adenylate cyclase
MQGSAVNTALLIIAVPALCIVGAFATTLRPALRPWVLPSIAVANSIGGLAVVCLWLMVFPDLESPLAGVVIISYFGFSIFRLHPLPALVTSGVFLAAAAGVAWHRWRVELIPFVSMFFDLSVLVIALQSGVIVSLAMQRLSRETYRKERIIERQSRRIDQERARADALLLNILPQQIADRLKHGERTIADSFPAVSVLFADIVGFTRMADELASEQVVAMLNELFSAFDDSSRRLGVEKIKTIGDCYMAVAGLPVPVADHADRAVELGLALLEGIQRYNATHAKAISVRIGINSGPAVAGIIGQHKYIYDLWGDSVNIASRMESNGLPGAIMLTEETRKLLAKTYPLRDNGLKPIKGKGEMQTWVLERHPQART